MNKKSFVIYLDLLDSLDELNDAQAGKLFKTIKAYHKSVAEGATQECVMNFESLLKDFVNRLAFAPFRAAFERDAERYQDRCRRYSENGKKGGRPKKEESNGFQKKPTKAMAFSEKQWLFQKAKKADNDNDSDNDNDIIPPQSPQGGDVRDMAKIFLEEFFAEGQNASLEQFAMSLRCKDTPPWPNLRRLAEEVINDLILQNRFPQYYSDQARAVMNIMRYKYQSYKNSNNENSRTAKSERHRGIEPSAKTKSDFEI